MKQRSILTATLVLSVLTVPAYAEVSDKVISIPDMLTWGAGAGLLGLIACRYRSVLIWITLPIGLLLTAEGLATIHDRFVGPAIVHEAGAAYAIAAYAALFFVALGNGVGYWLNKRRVRPVG
jgi:hypothetical protein